VSTFPRIPAGEVFKVSTVFQRAKPRVVPIQRLPSREAEYSREMCAGQILSLGRLPRHEPDSIETHHPLRSCYPEKPVGGLSNIGRGRDGAIRDAPHCVTMLGDPPVRRFS